MKTVGYSGTPLAKKLGVKENSIIKLINQPGYYYELFTDFPDSVKVVNDSKSKKDLIHYFTKNASRLHADIPKLRAEIEENGMIWISWPKRSSNVNTDLNGNIVRQIGLQNDLIDVKVCAVDEIWSGLKFVIPLKSRGNKINLR